MNDSQFYKSKSSYTLFYFAQGGKQEYLALFFFLSPGRVQKPYNQNILEPHTFHKTKKQFQIQREWKIVAEH